MFIVIVARPCCFSYTKYLLV